MQSENAIEYDLATMGAFFDITIPIVDIGCGVGTQSFYMGSKFKRVFGFDVSKTAIDLARTSCTKENVQFRVFDVLDVNQAKSLHQEIGDVNIYMRGLLHQITPEDRANAIESISILLGKKGVLYMLELTENANLFFAQLLRKNDKAAKAIESTLLPGITASYGVNVEKIFDYFPLSKFQLLDSGKKAIKFKINTESSFIDVPSSFAILKTKTY